MNFEDIIRIWPADLLCSEDGGLLVPRKPPTNNTIELACQSCQKNGQISMQSLLERIGTGESVDLLEEVEPIDPDKLPPEAREAFFALAGDWQILRDAGVTVDQILEAVFSEE